RETGPGEVGGGGGWAGGGGGGGARGTRPGPWAPRAPRGAGGARETAAAAKGGVMPRIIIWVIDMRIRHAAACARACAIVAGVFGVWTVGAGVARAQVLGPGPIALADGRVTIGGGASAWDGSDDPGVLHDTD